LGVRQGVSVASRFTGAHLRVWNGLLCLSIWRNETRPSSGEDSLGRGTPPCQGQPGQVVGAKPPADSSQQTHPPRGAAWTHRAGVSGDPGREVKGNGGPHRTGRSADITVVLKAARVRRWNPRGGLKAGWLVPGGRHPYVLPLWDPRATVPPFQDALQRGALDASDRHDSSVRAQETSDGCEGGRRGAGLPCGLPPIHGQAVPGSDARRARQPSRPPDSAPAIRQAAVMYRVFFWLSPSRHVLTPYGVEHRRSAYRDL